MCACVHVCVCVCGCVRGRQKGKEVEKTEGGEAEDTGVMEGFGTWSNCWHW